MASAKLSTVLSCGNYGMSQNRCTDDSKEFIFVKMTDSAYRAIEEYQRNENSGRLSIGQRAKIQFIGNSGVINFPTQNSDVSHKFGFAIDAVEGGSLECIQQTQNDFDVIGSLAYRMRIHANEDVYDTTRTKMAIAEETEKSKCIREIKPNQTDIGRKVKKTVSSFSHQNTFGAGSSGGNGNGNGGVGGNGIGGASNRNKLIAQSNSPPMNGIGSGSAASRLLGISSKSRSPTPTMLHSSHHHLSNLAAASSASSLSSTLAGGITSGYASASHNSPPKFTSGSGGGSSDTRGSGSQSNSKGGSQGGKKNSDVCRRNIRERLIHLLALKPYKKPELYNRLQNEGLRDRERSLISNILKDISTLSRDNTYNLRRQIWNDVNETWPFYNEQELQLVKRRKPQNLTPPMSSDAGSSTSGQSPSSTHRGSPPALSGGRGDMKRGYLDYDRPDEAEAFVNAVQTKKQRISHFRKESAVTSTATPVMTGSGSGSGSGVGVNSFLSGSTARSSANGTQQATDDSNSRNFDYGFNIGDHMDEYMTNVDSNSQMEYSNSGKSSGLSGSASGSGINSYNKYSDMFLDKRRVSPNLSNSSPSYGNRGSGNPNQQHKSNNSPGYENPTAAISSSGKHKQRSSSSAGGQRQQQPSQQSQQQQQQHQLQKQQQQKPQSQRKLQQEVSSAHSMNHASPQQQQQQQQQQLYQQHQPQAQPQQLNHHHQQQQQQPPQQQQHQHRQQNSLPTQHFNPSFPLQMDSPPKYDFSNYTPIASIEQRRLYKSEFESDYDEYLKLMDQIQGVSQRFQGLVGRLEHMSEDCSDYNMIKQQIVDEYERLRKEEALIRNKQRFDYLYEKLAYIKKLVSDYDKSLTSGAVTSSQQQPPMHQQQQLQMQEHDQDRQQLPQYQFEHQQQLQPQQQQLQLQQQQQQLQQLPQDEYAAADILHHGNYNHQMQQQQQLQHHQQHHQQQQQYQHQQLMGTSGGVGHEDADDNVDDDDDDSDDSSNNKSPMPMLHQHQHRHQHQHHHQQNQQIEDNDDDDDDDSDSDSNDDDEDGY